MEDTQSYGTYLPPWPAAGRRRPRIRRKLIAAVAVGALAVVGGVVTAVSLTTGHSSSSASTSV